MARLSSIVRTCVICVMAAAFCAAQAPATKSPAGFMLSDRAFMGFQDWIGGDGDRFGVTRDKLADFLREREKNLNTATLPKWYGWLKNMNESQHLELRAWALARRLEAGDIDCYAEYQKIIFDHVMTISKPDHSGERLKEILINYDPIPGPFTINNNSDFWDVFERTIRRDPKLNLSESHYAVWCFNTHPEQREFIFDICRNVLLKSNKKSVIRLWQDPRFWITLDWLYSWGKEDDFVKAYELLPKNAKSTFSNLHKEAKKLPGFFNSKLYLPNVDVYLEKIDDGNKTVDASISGAKLKRRPPPPGYPREARSRSLMTELALEITLDETGSPIACRPKPGPWLAFFAPTGIKYAMSFEFEPAEINGEPIVSRFMLYMPFLMLERSVDYYDAFEIMTRYDIIRISR